MLHPRPLKTTSCFHTSMTPNIISLFCERPAPTRPIMEGIGRGMIDVGPREKKLFTLYRILDAWLDLSCRLYGPNNSGFPFSNTNSILRAHAPLVTTHLAKTFSAPAFVFVCLAFAMPHVCHVVFQSHLYHCLVCSRRWN